MFSCSGKNISKLLAIVLLIGWQSCAVAQDSKTEAAKSYHVEFIRSICTNNDTIKKINKEKIVDFILGKKKTFLQKPVSVALFNETNTVILDQGNKNVLLAKSEDGKIDFLESEKTILPSPIGICCFTEGNYLITDSYLNKIYKASEKDKSIEIFNISHVLEQPTGIAYIEKKNEIWVSETKAHRIAILDKDGNLIRTIGTRGDANGEFNFPTYIWADSNDKVYVVDAMNFRIQIFNLNGEFISSFGEIGDATGTFARPKGLAVDSKGHIFVADALFNAIQVFDQKGNFLYTFGKQGSGTEAFWMPCGIFIDRNDIIYVSDTYNSRIQVFKLVENED